MFKISVISIMPHSMINQGIHILDIDPFSNTLSRPLVPTYPYSVSSVSVEITSSYLSKISFIYDRQQSHLVGHSGFNLSMLPVGPNITSRILARYPRIPVGSYGKA